MARTATLRMDLVVDGPTGAALEVEEEWIVPICGGGVGILFSGSGGIEYRSRPQALQLVKISGLLLSQYLHFQPVPSIDEG